MSMKRVKKVFSAVLVSALIISLISFPEQAMAKSKKTPKLNKTSITLTVGKSYKLKVKNGKAVKFSTSNKKIVTVSSKGMVKAKKKGICKIKVKVKNYKKTLTCKVIVKEKPAKKTTTESKSNEKKTTEKKTTEKKTTEKTTEKTTKKETTTEKTTEQVTTETSTTEKTPAQICEEQGHDWIGGYKDHTMSSCYLSGTTGTNECLRCGKVETFVYDAVEHTWAGGVHKDHTMSNCNLSGTTGINYCVVCGKSDRFIYDIVEHNMVTETVPATCEEKGSEKTYCTDCGKVESSKTLSALGHSWIFDENTEWDCCHTGHIKKHCEYCGEVEEYDTTKPSLIECIGPFETKYEYLDLGSGLQRYWCKYCTGCGKRVECYLFD